MCEEKKQDENNAHEEYQVKGATFVLSEHKFFKNYKIDFSRITSLETLVLILKGLDITYKPLEGLDTNKKLSNYLVEINSINHGVYFTPAKAYKFDFSKIFTLEVVAEIFNEFGFYYDVCGEKNIDLDLVPYLVDFCLDFYLDNIQDSIEPMRYRIDFSRVRKTEDLLKILSHIDFYYTVNDNEEIKTGLAPFLVGWPSEGDLQ